MQGGLAGILLAAWLIAGSVFPAQAQRGFAVDAMAVRAATGAPELEVYTAIPYTSLRFLNTADGFTARYEMHVEVYAADDRDRRGELVRRQSWEEAVTVANFAATQLDHVLDRTRHTMALPPGRYVFDCRAEDVASGRAFEHQMSVVVRDLAGPVSVSDLLLVEPSSQVDDRVPNPSRRVGAEQLQVKLYYETYTRTARRVRSTLEVIRPSRGGGLPIVGSLFGIGRDEVEIDYATTSWINLTPGRTPTLAAIPLQNLEEGAYVARIRLEAEDGTVLGAAEKPFTVEQWDGLETHILDLASAVEQLRYIAKDRELDYIRAATSEAEQRRRLQAFWERRDPTPGTARNERMMEYYQRVDHANRRYGAGQAGWRTDRGQVLVLFGPPDLVEQYNGEEGPYQLWHYDRIARSFIFVDPAGTGNFQLRTPLDGLRR